MARNKKNEIAEVSSDEEELFSYLKKVHKVKLAEYEVNEVETLEAEQEEYEHYKDKQAEQHEIQQAEHESNTENLFANKPYDSCQANQSSDFTSDVVLDYTSKILEDGAQIADTDKITNKTFEDDVQNSDANKLNKELHIAAQCDEIKKTSNTDNGSIISAVSLESKLGQQIETDRCTESNALANNLENFIEPSSIKDVEPQKSEFIAENKDTSPLKEDADIIEATVSKQNPESSRESDRYYLINEKDWLSVCAKLSGREKQQNLKENQDVSKTDSVEEDMFDKQDATREALVGTKPQPLMSKSTFSAIKQYYPVTNTALKKADLDQTLSKAYPENVIVTPETKKLNIDCKGQTVTLVGNEVNRSIIENKILIDPKTPTSPEVEIVYIRLEDGQIKYDASKSPLTTSISTKESNLQAVKKLKFSEPKKGLEFEKTTQDHASIATNGIQLKSQENVNGRNANSSQNFHNAHEDNQESSNPNKSFNFTGNTGYDTTFKPGMQVRFVRINNKLTRVYENVEHNVVLHESSDDKHNKNEHQECLDLENCDGDDDEEDSFSFDDSQLVAFPLNAIDSITQLTPSKLEFLNSSDKADPLTPSKLEFSTPDKLDTLVPNKLEMLTPSNLDSLTLGKCEMFTPSKLGLFSPSKLEILPTNEIDMFGDNNDVTKSDECLSSPKHSTRKQVQTADSVNEEFEMESSIVLKVTKSGELVQCKSNEGSPERKVYTQQRAVTTSEHCQQNQKSHIQNLWKSFKPVQKKSKVTRKQHSLVEENKDADYEYVENSNNRNEGSSDDDLANYFSMKNYSSKDSVSKKSSAPSYSISVQASFSDSSDDPNENEEAVNMRNKKVRKRKFRKVVGEKMKVNNKKLKIKCIAEDELEAKPFHEVKMPGNKKETVHTAKATNDNTKVEFKTMSASKLKQIRNINEMVGNKEEMDIKKANIDKTIKSCGNIDSKTCLSDNNVSDFVNGNKDQTYKKRKGNRQILHFYKDCNYKQVDFKDFELEDAHMTKAPNMDKGKQEGDLHIEGKTEVKKRPNNVKLKERDKMSSADIKVKELKVRKRNVNSDEEGKQTNVSLNQVTSKRVKKSCLKKGQEKNKSKKVKYSTEEYETGLQECKPDDMSKTSSNDESQKKIEFLEKLFQIKLKQAACDTTDGKSSTPESSPIKTLLEENSKSKTSRKSKNKTKSSAALSLLCNEIKVPELPVAQESVKRSKNINLRNKKCPAVRKDKGRKGESSDKVVSDSNSKQVSDRFLSDQKSQGIRKRNSSEKVGKGRHVKEQNIPAVNDNKEKDTSDNGQNDTCIDKRIQTVDSTKPSGIKQSRGRPRKEKVTIGDCINSCKNEAQTVPTVFKCDCYKIKQGRAVSKSNSQGKKAKRKSKVSTVLESEKLNRVDDGATLSANAVEIKFTEMLKPKGKPKVIEVAKTKEVEANSLTKSTSNQQAFIENIELKASNTKPRSKMNVTAKATKNNLTKSPPVKTQTKNNKSKKNSMNTGSSKGGSDYVQNSELKSSSVADSIVEEQLDDTRTSIGQSQKSDLLNSGENLSSNFDGHGNQNSVVSILATFQPLQDDDELSQTQENKTKNAKRKKTVSDDQNVSKIKKVKKKAEVCDEDEAKQLKQENIIYLDADKHEMPLDLSLPRKEALEAKDSSPSEDNNSKSGSPEKLRDGKALKKSWSRKAAVHKTLKSARQSYSSRKIKNVTKRQEKESWKDMLDDGAFKFDFDKKVSEEHKPVNVKHMIRNILQSVKGAEEITDRHDKHRERKDRINKHYKSSGRNIKQRLLSESDDAWLSDSGPIASFPAFRFTGMSDSEDNRQSSKSQLIDNPLIITERGNNSKPDLDGSGSDRGTEMQDSKLCTQGNTETENNFLELHDSPLKVTSSQVTNSAYSENSGNLTSIETKENTQGSPEMKKNVDKLRALLDKVSDKRVHVVKNLQFADDTRLSDTEH